MFKLQIKTEISNLHGSCILKLKTKRTLNLNFRTVGQVMLPANANKKFNFNLKTVFMNNESIHKINVSTFKILCKKKED